MNILTDKLPTAVRVDGKVYPVNTDFRVCLKIVIAFEDPELASAEKQTIMCRLLYGKNIPDNLEAACMQAVKFLNCGESINENEEPAGENIGRLYSFSQDAGFIFTAINQTHGIDLESVSYLHWWKFTSYFLDLSEECFFSRLIYLRRQKKTGKWTKEEKEWYYSIQKIADLPEDELHDENLDNFISLFKGGG